MKKNKDTKFTKGFTLIEMLVYIGLFGIIMGGIITSVYQLSQSSSKTNTKVIAEEEMSFLLRKMSWLFTGMKSSTISISNDKKEITFQNPSLASGTIKLRLNPSNVIEVEKNGETNPLSTVNINVEKLEFTYNSVKKTIDTYLKVNGMEITTSKLLII